ncbi:GntP family permease [Mongoliitalea daihaiensis]|uniref:GntP family permease n=1 Tax=Mongoliitalea daihaiensis TaxID=2782006 RepID=UPI001F2AA0B2|nr:GntP family permease [Mongoliitalea daihaiensis]UJP64560.1 GntP family permease [Mongoliitalea daihaiensis]
MEIIAIISSLVLLMVLAYRGYPVILIAPLLAVLAVMISGEKGALAFYSEVFMKGLGNFIIKYFPIFLLGAIFGKLMDATGAARSISREIIARLGEKHAIIAVVASCALLTYGGVSIFIVAFGIFPMAKSLFQEANIPKRLIPGTIALGSFTFSMTALPGTVQIHNIIPIPYFQTDAFAAPLFGLIGSLIIASLGVTWLQYRSQTAQKQGLGYGFEEDNGHHYASVPPFWKSLVPILFLISLNFLFSQLVIPKWDADFLQNPAFGNATLDSVKGIWSIILAMLLAIGLLILLHFKQLPKLKDDLQQGIQASLMPVFNTATEVGYGSTIAALAGFEMIKNYVLHTFQEIPLLSAALAINLLAGITGSASGGLAIALETLGSTYYEIMVREGVSLELMHRVASMASSGLDSLPHNGAVITLLMICGLTHRQSYLDIAITTLIIPVSTLFIMILSVSIM